VPQAGIEPTHPAYKTGPLPLRIQGQIGEPQLCRDSLLAESRGVEPHPISENLVFKASRRTIPAALLSIVWYPESDSNRHDSPFERDASYQLGYRGIKITEPQRFYIACHLVVYDS
jgi:hypothetical protein